MNPSPSYSKLGQLVVESIQKIDHYEAQLAAHRERDTIHIPTVGSRLSVAYEQLRNASEYTEDNLLRQRAIRRFLARNLSFHEKNPTKQLANELITELTQAGYIPNDHSTKSDIKTTSQYIKRYYTAYWNYAKIEKDISRRQAFQAWMLDVLSVRCEQVLHSNIRQTAFTQLAFTYLYPKLDIAKMVRTSEVIHTEDYPIVLYIAIQKAILKQDNAAIRTSLIDSYKQDVTLIHNFESFNKKLDYLFDTKTVSYTTRIVNRNGAALRIMYNGIYSEQGTITLDAFKSPTALEYAIRQQTEKEYNDLERRLDKGILKSIIFLIITKSIIGLSIEVPYDLAIEKHIVWLPLILNLFFPAVFILLSRLTLSTPGNRNTTAITDQVLDIVYSEPPQTTLRIPKETRSAGFNIVYGIMFGIMFAGVSYLLYLLQFNIVQGVIFFIFLSTASFLAFRLAQQIRELEAITASQGSLSLLRDILYLPFIYVGQQISYRYARVNIVATILDLLIELPLKTVLRLVRQWSLFLSSKKDELV